MNIKTTINKIKGIEIQGAEAIAREGVKAINGFIQRSKAKTPIYLIHQLNTARKALESARPTEPLLRNSLKYICENIKIKGITEIKKEILERSKKVLDHFETAQKEITAITIKKIKNGCVIFTFCHSDTVTRTLIEAYKQGIDFDVFNTETRPLYQGRTTATLLSNAGIRVTHFVDAAARTALKKADLFLFGADAITSNGEVYNKMGTELMLEIAKKYDVLCYCCADSWKFDASTIFGFEESTEERIGKEVWPNAPKNIKICNFAFEKCKPELIDGIISELGIFKPETFVEETIKRNPWLIR